MTKDHKDDSLRIFSGYNLKRAFNAIQMDLNACLAQSGLRMITFSVLSIIDENPGIRQSGVAELLVIERPNMVVIIDELEQAMLIQRDRSEQDRRAYELRITDTGKTRLEQARQAVIQHEARMCKDIADSDIADMISTLRTIESNGLGRI